MLAVESELFASIANEGERLSIETANLSFDMAADCLSEEKPNPKLSEFTVMVGDTNAFELVMSQLSTFEFTEEATETSRGDKGFGSSDKKIEL